MPFTMPIALTLAAMNPRSRFRRSLLGSELPEQSEHVYARNLEVPAGGGVGTARAVARAYSVFATGGRELGVREETLRQLMAPAVPPARGFRDACMKVELQFSLGFMKPSPGNAFAHPSAFGSPGTGGVLRVCRSPRRRGVRVHPQSDGHPPAGPERGRAAQGDVPLDRRDGPLPRVRTVKPAHHPRSPAPRAGVPHRPPRSATPGTRPRGACWRSRRRSTR